MSDMEKNLNEEELVDELGDIIYTLTDEEIVLAAEEYTVFGRVTPEQKVLLVKTPCD